MRTSGEVLSKVFRNLLPLADEEEVKIRISIAEEQRVVKRIGVLYDLLADAVDEINKVFSKEVCSRKQFSA